MASRLQGAVRVDGLRDLQRDLKALDPDVRREVTKALKEGADVVARATGPLAARRTGKLAGSFKPGASQMQAYVRSRLPYAGVLEYGGVIKPKGAPVTITAHPAATLALKRNEEKIVDHIGDAIERVASKHGWS
jgi:hypothetical protein